MAVTEKNIIKDWFKTGLKPLQEQFWAWMDSYWHKNELIPPASIEGLAGLLNSKAEAEALTSHLTDTNAHPEIATKARIIPIGKMLVFKVAPNENENLKEIGDFCMGIVEDTFVNGNWDGGDEALAQSYGMN
jgi:hypothetical protein